jgi:5-methylcytosine-specific restriction protein A
MYSFRKKIQFFGEKKQADNRKFYDSSAWRGKNGLRKLRLNLNPFCQICELPANTVDHIKPINMGGDPYDLDNTQSLCEVCHNKKRNKEKQQYAK